MSIELGTYSQGEYIPRKNEKRRVLGTTALTFSSAENIRSSFDPYVNEDSGLDAELSTTFEDIQPSYALSREEYQLARRDRQSLRNRAKRQRRR
jgi:hypothetical protein